jgi:hypothetical protein
MQAWRDLMTADADGDPLKRVVEVADLPVCSRWPRHGSAFATVRQFGPSPDHDDQIPV